MTTIDKWAAQSGPDNRAICRGVKQMFSVGTPGKHSSVMDVSVTPVTSCISLAGKYEGETTQTFLHRHAILQKERAPVARRLKVEIFFMPFP